MGESEWFRIDRRLRQGCILSPQLFNVYMDEDGGGKEGRERKLPGFLYADCSV